MVPNDAVNDPEILEALYWQDGLSMWQMADRLGCSETTVYRRMVQFGIDRRGRGYNDASGLVESPVHHYTRYDGYEELRHSHKGEKERVYVHQLILISQGENPHDVFSDEYHSHHNNRIRWDNRPSNLELLTVEDHLEHHGSRGHLGNSTEYTEKELLAWIDAFVEEFGYVPTRTDVQDWPGPSLGTYDYRFGGWIDALNEAGWKRPDHTTDINGRIVRREDPQPIQEANP